MDNVKFDQTADVDTSSTFNLEAEQALIGLLLVNNEVLGEIEAIIGEDHFYDAINRKIFGHIASRTNFLWTNQLWSYEFAAMNLWRKEMTYQLLSN